MNVTMSISVIGCLIVLICAIAGMRLARMNSIIVDLIVGASAILLFAWIILSKFKF
jgi:hypothetical protein